MNAIPFARWAIRLVLSIALFGCLWESPSRGADGPDAVKELRKEKVIVLKEIYELAKHAHQAGQGSAARINESRRDLLNAQLDLCETKTERINVLKELVQAAEESSQAVQALVQSGAATKSDAIKVKVLILDAKIALALEMQNEKK